MRYNARVSAAVAAILGAPAAGWAQTAATADTSATASEGIQEITVTAQRRTENIQNVPITIQALTAETLSQLNVTTFDDYIKYLPNVTAAGYGPGQSNIYMRGLSSGTLGTQGAGTDAEFPNVAVYLDDLSAQMPYRNLDIYAVDIERIEVLEGPQGTLFGAGAEAGAIRYITNKPKLDTWEGNFNAGYGTTAHGDPNSNFDATLNVPLIQNTLAVRTVVYDDARGGYINNVPQTFTRSNADLGIGYAGGKVPPGSPVINNESQLGNAINPTTYTGIRGELLWKVNDDWNALLSQSYQDMNSQGVFFQMPHGSDYQINHQELPDLSVTLFNPSYNKDRFDATSLTVNGRISDLKVVYTGAYLDRHVDSEEDYTNYTRGYFADFYQCTTDTHYGVPGPDKCYSPSASWREDQRIVHESHEIRLSTPDDWRTRALLGGFWENFTLYDNTDWFYKSVPACTATLDTGCLSDIAPPVGATANVPGIRPDNESFFDDIQRSYRQYAVFGSLDFDLIPKILTLTGGTRYYHFTNTQTGSGVSSFGCQDAGPAPCTAGASNDNAKHLDNVYTGSRSRGNLTWHVTPDAMLYYTWSQGFRPGGFNRVSALHADGQYFTPQGFSPDSLTNNELGFKTEWLDHRLQVNGTLYQEQWDNVQLQFFNPAALGNLSFVTNGADYRVRGFELQMLAQPIHGLTIQGSAAWNRTEQTNSPSLIDNNPASPNFGHPVTGITNPYGLIGSPLANSPPFEGNLRVRYEWNMANNYLAFVQVGGTRQGESLSAVGTVPPIAVTGSINQRYLQPGFTTYDASLGVSRDNWNAALFGENITDTRGITFISQSEAIETETVIRPRILGLRVGYKF
jgi:outer membrane receptor protein involved in Fe transport